jgi:hypothetical protein
MSWIFLMTVAFANDAGFYHPADVASVSEAFAEVNGPAAEGYHALSTAARTAASALNHYEESLDLLGASATQAERDRHAALTSRFHRDFAVAQDFAAAVLDDTETSFAVGLESAISTLSTPPTVCEKPSSGTSVTSTGMRLPGRASREAACEGEDKNGEIAALIDGNEAVRTAIREISGRKWPALQLETAPQAPTGWADATGWLDLRKLFTTAAGDPLAQIIEADEDARATFEEAITEGTTVEERQAMVSQAEQVTAQTAASRAALARPVIAAIEGWNTKRQKKGLSTVALCANPVELGGCAGTDLTLEVLEPLLTDKKVRKALGQ